MAFSRVCISGVMGAVLSVDHARSSKSATFSPLDRLMIRRASAARGACRPLCGRAAGGLGSWVGCFVVAAKLMGASEDSECIA